MLVHNIKRLLYGTLSVLVDSQKARREVEEYVADSLTKRPFSSRGIVHFLAAERSKGDRVNYLLILT